MEGIKHIQPKRLFVEIFLVLFLSFHPGTDAVHAQTPEGPRAFVPETHFEFPPVFEGQEVRHDFVIQNRGTVPLDITDVRTG